MQILHEELPLPEQLVPGINNDGADPSHKVSAERDDMGYHLHGESK